MLPGWKPAGDFAENPYAVRPHASHVPLAVAAFVTFLRQAWTAGFDSA